MVSYIRDVDTAKITYERGDYHLALEQWQKIFSANHDSIPTAQTAVEYVFRSLVALGPEKRQEAVRFYVDCFIENRSFVSKVDASQFMVDIKQSRYEGLRNDIEVFRCRGLIDETPVYQAHLAKINALRHQYPELLLEGRYTATDGFTCSNPALTARSFTSGGRMAVVVTNTGEKVQKGKIAVPGYRFVEGRDLEGKIIGKPAVNLGQYELNVLIYEK